MKIIIKSKKIKVSPELNLYIEKRITKLGKFLKGVDQDLIEATIEIDKTTGKQRKGKIYQTRVNLKFPGRFFRSEVQSEDLYSSIDEVKEELEIEIRKFKDKSEALFKRGARSIKKIYNISPLARFRKK